LSDEPIKRRQLRAKNRAIEILRQAGYEIVRSDNEKVCVIGARDVELRVIRICVDKVTPADIDILRKMRFLRAATVSREAWCFDGRNFDIREIPVKY
jgi:hypothetical protein